MGSIFYLVFTLEQGSSKLFYLILIISTHVSSLYRKPPNTGLELLIPLLTVKWVYSNCSAQVSSPCVKNINAQLLTVSSQFLIISLPLASALLSIPPVYSLRVF
jgi:hypothetical protein